MSILKRYSLILAACVTMFTQVDAGAYMLEPFCRGCENTYYSSIGLPNTGGEICHGEPTGRITEYIDDTINISLNITSARTGPCQVYLLDEDLSNPVLIASRRRCVAKCGINHWSIKVPSDIQGHKILRWVWFARKGRKTEVYEQCADVALGGVNANALAAEEGGFATLAVPTDLDAEPEPELTPASVPASAPEPCESKQLE
jgi:hypothetical protein